MNNIYLIGMMGSGKTATGKKLASLLRCSFVDVDESIQQKTGRTIVELFEKEGEGYFRNQESKVLDEISKINPCVVATGGGTVLRRENISLMRRTGKTVFLDASLDVLWERVKVKRDRPLLKGANPRENLARLFDERKIFYEGASDFRVKTDAETPDRVARAILEWLEKKQ